LLSIRWPQGGNHHERYVPLPLHRPLEVQHLGYVDGLPSAESALSDGAPEWAVPDGGAAAAFRVVEQAPPQMSELAERADARDLSQHPVQERASAAPAASYVEDLYAPHRFPPAGAGPARSGPASQHRERG